MGNGGIRPFMAADFEPSDISSRIAFGGNRLDRMSEDRGEDDLEAALAHPEARALGFARGRVLIAFEEDGPRGLFAAAELEGFQPYKDRAVLLGYDDGRPRLAMPLAINPDEEDFSLPEPFKAVDYRSVAGQMLLSHDELGQLAQGAATLAWHSSARFCGRCGGETVSMGGGVKRKCTQCGNEVFPRTDPVVIMLTVAGDRCLLGRSPHFPPGMYSALAGFVEAGESLETAVRRETFEEAGIRIGKVTYHASQPWPFPHSLMIGCYGEALEQDIIADESELEDCRWFERAHILRLLDGAPAPEDPELFLPLKFAIARRLIQDWATNGR